jgi:hypothetical protein
MLQNFFKKRIWIDRCEDVIEWEKKQDINKKDKNKKEKE